MNFILSVSCVQRSFFFFCLFPDSQMRLPDMESEEHRCYHHLNKFCLLWNVQYGMILCMFVCLDTTSLA